MGPSFGDHGYGTSASAFRKTPTRLACRKLEIKIARSTFGCNFNTKTSCIIKCEFDRLPKSIILRNIIQFVFKIYMGINFNYRMSTTYEYYNSINNRNPI